VISSHIEETVKELTQSEGVKASVAEIIPERATTEIGEPSILPEEEATPKAGEESTLQGEEVTIEARETSTPLGSPKDSTSLDLPEVALTAPSLAVEAPAAITLPEVPVASTTLAQKEPACTPFFMIERGSGSTSGDDTMDFLTRKTVQQFLDAMRSCIDFILSGRSSFDFARTFLGNMAGNIELTGGSSLAKSCMLLVERLGSDLKELKSLDNASSSQEAQVILTRLLATQEQERQEVEAQVAEEVRNLERSQAECQKLADDSMESEFIRQNAELAITNARSAIAKAEAMIADNERTLATVRKRLEEQQAAKARAEESQTIHSSRLESLRAQLAAKPFLSEEELRVQAMMEAEKARQHEMHRLRERIRSLPDQDF